MSQATCSDIVKLLIYDIREMHRLQRTHVTLVPVSTLQTTTSSVYITGCYTDIVYKTKTE